MWRDKFKLKKTLVVQRNYTPTTENIYLPSLTNGVKWNNTVGIVGNAIINTKHNNGVMNLELKKQNDNSFSIQCYHQKYDYETKSYPLMVGRTVGKTIKNGVELDVMSPISFFIVARSSNTYTTIYLNINIYCDDILIKTINSIMGYTRSGNTMGGIAFANDKIPYGKHKIRVEAMANGSNMVQSTISITKKIKKEIKIPSKVLALFCEYD